MHLPQHELCTRNIELVLEMKSSFAELHSHGDKRLPTEVTSNTYFRACRLPLLMSYPRDRPGFVTNLHRELRAITSMCSSGSLPVGPSPYHSGPGQDPDDDGLAEAAPAGPEQVSTAIERAFSGKCFSRNLRPVTWTRFPPLYRIQSLGRSTGSLSRVSGWNISTPNHCNYALPIFLYSLLICCCCSLLLLLLLLFLYFVTYPGLAVPLWFRSTLLWGSGCYWASCMRNTTGILLEIQSSESSIQWLL